MQNKLIKDVTLTGIGIALFVVLSLCLQVPVFQNYYLCLGYVVMAVYLYSFGIRKGMMVGVFGTILYCFLINGLRGMPGWAIGNVFIAVYLGFAFKLGECLSQKYARYLIYAYGALGSCFMGIFIVKSLVEYFLYAQPMPIRMMSNMYAFIADTVVLLISIPICERLDKYINKITKNIDGV